MQLTQFANQTSPNLADLDANFALVGKIQAVFGTGVAATDVANLQAAVNAAPAGGVIDLFDGFTLNASVTVKPRIRIRNGGGATITVSGGTNGFALLDDLIAGVGLGTVMPAGMIWTGDVALHASGRCMDAYPGHIVIDGGIKFLGPLSAQDNTIQVNNELLGTYTLASHVAAIRLEINGQLCKVLGNWFQDFDTAVLIGGVQVCNIRENFVYNCKVGVLPFNMNGGSFSNYVTNCFVGTGISYGGRLGVNVYTIGGVNQRSFCNLWIEGSYEGSAESSLYFELAAFRDLQFGAGAGRDSIGLTIPMFMSASVCNNGDPDPAADYIMAGNPLFAGGDAYGTSIECRSGSSLHIVNALWLPGSIAGSRRVVRATGDYDNMVIGYDRVQSTNPWDFDQPGRVVIKRGGYERRGISDGDYYSNAFTWGDPASAYFGSTDDPTKPTSQIAEAYIRYKTTAGGRRALEIGNRNAANLNVNLLANFLGVYNTAGTMLCLSVKGGAAEFAGEEGLIETYTRVAARGPVQLTYPTVHAAAPTLAIDLGAITVTNPTSFLGAGAINTINGGVGTSFSTGGGTVILIPTAAFTWNAAGNIAIAGTAVIGRALHLTYDTGTAKWYPSYT